MTLAALACFPAVVHADSAVFRSFDGPQVNWQLLDSNANVQIVAHGCVGDEARQGSGSERLVINAPVGESVQFVCPIGRVPVLDELQASMWIKANQPGVALAARVVLPRSIDTKTDLPRTVIVTGPLYDQVDHWQQLNLSGVPNLLADQVRVLRATPGEQVDSREAYVDAIVLSVPGAIGSTAVWTDALAVDGIVVLASAEEPVIGAPATPQGWRHERPAMTAGVAPRPQPEIARHGTTITVSGRPFFARGVRWRDEPLAFLAARGFNTIWTDVLPTAEEMAQAERANLWFVCPPPRADAIAQQGLTMPLGRVLAWNLGRPEGRHDLDYFRRWAELVREKDPLDGRPIIVAPIADWLPCSKVGDVLLASHPASSRLNAAEYAQWLRTLPLLAQPGAQFWAAVPTQPGVLARQQAAQLAQRPQSSAMLDESQIELLVRTAAMSGCRGVLFESDAPLDANDETTAYRALVAESMNRELQLIEPWLTNGKSVGQAVVVDSSAAATVLQVDRARLVIPTAWHATSAEANSPTAAFVVPGVPESNEAYALSSAGLRPLVSKRVAGGVRVELDGQAAPLVLLTEDATVIASFRQRLGRDGRRAVQLERELALARAKQLVATARRLERFGGSSRDALQAVGAANAELAHVNSLVVAGKMEQAFQRAEIARRRLADASDRQRAADVVQPLVNIPFNPEFGTLAEQVELQRSLATLRGGENLLEGGDFENLAQLKGYGWQHVADPLAGIDGRAELSPRDPHVGRYALELSAKAVPPEDAPQIIARPLVWITSPPVRATADQLLEITGWVRVPEPIVGTIDGLQIVDSLGGPELALRITDSPGWQPFRLVRGVSETSDVSVTFVLAGLGTASIDDVAIRVLAHPSAKRLPPVTTVRPSTSPDSAQLPGPLFPAPGPR